MAIRVVFDDISCVVCSRAGESSMVIEGPQWLLLVEEGPRLLPSRPTLDGLVVDLLLQLHIHVINKTAQLFLDESHVVLGVLAGQVDIPEDFLGLEGHLI